MDYIRLQKQLLHADSTGANPHSGHLHIKCRRQVFEDTIHGRTESNIAFHISSLLPVRCKAWSHWP